MHGPTAATSFSNKNDLDDSPSTHTKSELMRLVNSARELPGAEHAVECSKCSSRRVEAWAPRSPLERRDALVGACGGCYAHSRAPQPGNNKRGSVLGEVPNNCPCDWCRLATSFVQGAEELTGAQVIMLPACAKAQGGHFLWGHSKSPPFPSSDIGLDSSNVPATASVQSSS